MGLLFQSNLASSIRVASNIFVAPEGSEYSKGKNICFLSGVPGSGKSFFILKMRNIGLRVFDIDRHSSSVDGKWICRWNELGDLNDIDVICGTCDNISEGVAVVSSFSSFDFRFNLYGVWVVAPYVSWKSVIKLRVVKLSDYDPNGLLNGFVSMSFYSKHDYEKYCTAKCSIFEGLLCNNSEKVGVNETVKSSLAYDLGVHFFVVLNDFESPKDAWHI